jgi:uncharacterized membrane protein YsdA (DUF1294 family)
LSGLLWIAPLYLIAINSITYFAFWIDKQRAWQRGYRIPENDLLFLAVIGGSPAAFFARRHLRHKTKKQPFSAFLLCILGFQIGAAFLIFVISAT